MKQLLMALGLLSIGAVSCAPYADYTAWDADNDGYLSRDEYYTGTYDTWDADDDTYLYEDEVYTGLRESGVYSNWDINRDADLDRDEYGYQFGT
jgi:hypothetical protein